MTVVDEASRSKDSLAHVANVWKSYGGVPVLTGVNLDLKPGEIHALVGGNGAGKSTLMKVITGVVSPDSGSVVVAGKELRNLSPRAAHENGIYMVPQEPKLFPSLSVRENISLSLEGLKVSNAAIESMAQQIAPQINLDENADQLSISDQQLVEIIRGMLREAKVLIVDEPTASLTVQEVNRLFGHLRDLAAQGVGIFYITHRMNEIFEICDRVAVLRDGTLVSDRPVLETSVDEVVAEMIPNSTVTHGNSVAVAAAEKGIGPVVLEVNGLTGQGFTDVSLEVRAGEIVGLAGVVGSGRTELAETIYGVRQGVGEVKLYDKRLDKRSPAISMAEGLSYVPEDRHANGVFLLGTIIENSTSGVLKDVSRGLRIRHRFERSKVEDLTDSLDLQKGGLDRQVGNLSGGNQQKVSLAKSLANAPKAIILDEPSRGVDVGARGDLYRLIGELADAGTAVLVISSDFEEVVDVSDRILIMRGGTIREEITKHDITLETVRDRCFGISRKDA